MFRNFRVATFVACASFFLFITMMQSAFCFSFDVRCDFFTAGLRSSSASSVCFVVSEFILCTAGGDVTMALLGMPGNVCVEVDVAVGAVGEVNADILVVAKEEVSADKEEAES